VVAGEPVDACGGGSLFSGRDGSGRRIDGLHGGELQRKGRVAGLCGVVPSNEEQEGGGVACCGRHPVGSRGAGSGARGRADGRRRRKREGKEQRKTKGKREKREKKLRKKEIGE
jgi:hypothetical protein